MNLIQSSGNGREDNERNNEKEDRNLIYATNCTIRISFLAPISYLNNKIFIKIKNQNIL